MLTERAVERSWRQLFRGGTTQEDDFDKAVTLIDELRPESPLRIRLASELEELKKIHAKRQKVAH